MSANRKYWERKAQFSLRFLLYYTHIISPANKERAWIKRRQDYMEVEEKIRQTTDRDEFLKKERLVYYK